MSPMRNANSLGTIGSLAPFHSHTQNNAVTKNPEIKGARTHLRARASRATAMCERYRLRRVQMLVAARVDWTHLYPL